MPKKTIYVRDADVQLWARAEELGEELGGASLSGILANALRRYVEEEELRKETNMETIEVETGDDVRPGRVAFTGLWLVNPADEIRTAEPNSDPGICYGVAETQRGRVAVYTYHINGGSPAKLNDYDSFEDAEKGGHPPDILSDASEVMGSDYVQKLDI